MTSRNRKRKRKKYKAGYLKTADFGLKIVGLVCVLFATFATASGVWQFVKNPYLVVAGLIQDAPKALEETWRVYSPSFHRHRTNDLPATFLAAIAQTESSGRQWTATEWQFHLDRGILNFFSPQSTSFGIMQFTKSTFETAKNFCVVNTKVETSKPWYMLDGCWFSSIKTRGSADNSIEIAAAYLQNYINEAELQQKSNISQINKLKFAATSHLCGVGVANRLLDNSFKINRKTSCGSHNLSRYISKVLTYEKRFRSIDQSLIASK